MIRILVSDKLAAEGIEILQSASDVQVDVKTGLKPGELAGIIGGYDGLIIRSGTKVTAEVLAAPGKLRAIARAGVGVDNVDVPTATRKGIVVMNTPDGNTITTAEQTLCLLFALARHTVDACQSLRSGKWERSSFMGRQLAGKTLGVVGLGRIGRAVAERALGLAMQVIGYDPYFAELPAGLKGRVEMTDDLDDLCRRCDYLTVHTVKTEQTTGLIGKSRLALMKKTAAVINCARGGIVDEDALYEALDSGKLSGAALDVYTKEPPEDRRLIDHPKVICTPHLGASTAEAQTQVAVDAARQLLTLLTTGEVINAVNAPGHAAGLDEMLRPYISLAQRMGTILARVNPGRAKKLTITYSGEIAEMDPSAVTVSLLVGLLADQTEEPVNAINVQLLMRDRGIEVKEVKSSVSGDFSSLIATKLETDKGTRTIAGTVFSGTLPRIVGICDYRMEMVPEGNMLITFNDDKPGVIGGMGGLFGKHGVNIGSLTFGRKLDGQKSVMVFTLDSEPSKEILAEMSALPYIHAVHFIPLPALNND